MKPEIMIRTYAGDADWLDWCLNSCDLRVPDLPVLVVCPDGDADVIRKVTNNWDVPLSTTTPTHKDGYLDQQWTKLHADCFCAQATHIIHVDSDCIWIDGWESLFQDGKPLLLKTPYRLLEGDGAYAWRRITGNAIGFVPNYEYMRRQPLVYPRELYKIARDRMRSLCPNEGLENWFKGIKDRSFSEFNVLGAIADLFLHDQFVWLDTETDELPDPVAIQGWSWGGLKGETLEKWKEHVR